MFKKLYNKVLVWSKHPSAERILMALSFFESSCFPVPPDVMLAPMTMAKPKQAWRLAFITTVFSVLGGIFGYILGYSAYHTVVMPLLDILDIQDAYGQALTWFNDRGIWIILIAAFTPIPYKVFTIAAGTLQMNLVLFIVGSIVGRGARFYMVCALFKFGSKYLSEWIQRWIDVIGWGALILIVLFYYFMIR